MDEPMIVVREWNSTTGMRASARCSDSLIFTPLFYGYYGIFSAGCDGPFSKQALLTGLKVL